MNPYLPGYNPLQIPLCHRGSFLGQCYKNFDSVGEMGNKESFGGVSEKKGKLTLPFFSETPPIDFLLPISPRLLKFFFNVPKSCFHSREESASDHDQEGRGSIPMTDFSFLNLTLSFFSGTPPNDSSIPLCI